MSPLPPLVGRAELTAVTARAAIAGRLPRSILLHGSRGVGKQRFALWLGQILLCEAPVGSGPCGRCRSCRMVDRLEHPDLLWYFPVKRPPSRGSRERDQEALEDIRADLLASRRENPLLPSHTPEPVGLHVGTVRNLRREAMKGPALAGERVVVVADAEELVSQDASPEAANALLKVLEEPPRATRLILTSSEPGRLLPTIRSRTTAIFLPPLSTAEVEAFLVEHADADREAARRAASLAGGSIGRGLGLLPAGEDPGPLEEERQAAFHLLRAAMGARPEDRFLRPLEYGPAGARGLLGLLASLEDWLRDLAVLASGVDGVPLLNEDARAWLGRAIGQHPVSPAAVARSMGRVEHARRLAAANVNPQLLLHDLLSELHDGLVPTEPTRAREAP